MMIHSDSRRCWSSWATIAVAATIAFAWTRPAAASIVFGQFSDFQDGTTQGWGQGGASAQPSTNVSTGGPTGAGDRYLENISTGDPSRSSGKQIILNTSQWIGNYNAAGVTRISAMVANFAETDLYLRVAFQDTFGTRFASTTAFALPANTGWTPVTFGLTAASLTSLGGADDLPTALGSVTQLRILSAQFGPAFLGDAVASTLSVDDIRALRLPGDANFDGTVNLADFVLLSNNFGVSGTTWAKGDFNFDGKTDFADFVLLSNNFGKADSFQVPAASQWSAGAAVASAPAPEPGAGMIALISAAGLLASRRRMRVS